MNNRISALLALMWLLGATTVVPQTILAQNTPRDDETSKKPATTLDAWRQALPEAEQQLPLGGNAENAEEDENLGGDVEKRLIDLEHTWIDAVKRHDETSLARILSPDFTLTDERSTTNPTDRERYINRVTRSWRLGTYRIDKTTVRLYGNAAVVNIWYMQQGEVRGKETIGEFLATDVWVKQNGRWQVVSRHMSQQAKAQQ